MWNEEKKYQGFADISITQRYIDEAKKLSKKVIS